LPSQVDTRTEPFRFPVQRVLRPDAAFRGFSGQIASGTVRPGDEVAVMPSGRRAVVERIVTWDGDLDEAIAPLSVTLVLDRELDISRGDLIVAAQAPATVVKSLKAAMVWMDQKPLVVNRRYLLKHTSQTAPAFVTSVEHRTDIGTLAHEAAETLEMNGIGVVALNLLRPIALDLYGENRSTGAFILMDPETNATVAAGMVTGVSGDAYRSASGPASEPVTPRERATRWGHRGGLLELSGPTALIDQIERSLFSRGVITARINTGDEVFKDRTGLLESVVKLNVRSGFLVLVAALSGSDRLIARAEGHEITLTSNNPEGAIQGIRGLLTRAGILRVSESVDWEI
jgi:sulfate adenylyltransferase subunit 1